MHSLRISIWYKRSWQRSKDLQESGKKLVMGWCHSHCSKTFLVSEWSNLHHDPPKSAPTAAARYELIASAHQESICALIASHSTLKTAITILKDAS